LILCPLQSRTRSWQADPDVIRDFPASPVGESVLQPSAFLSWSWPLAVWTRISPALRQANFRVGWSCLLSFDKSLSHVRIPELVRGSGEGLGVSAQPVAEPLAKLNHTLAGATLSFRVCPATHALACPDAAARLLRGHVGPCQHGFPEVCASSAFSRSARCAATEGHSVGAVVFRVSRKLLTASRRRLRFTSQLAPPS